MAAASRERELTLAANAELRIDGDVRVWTFPLDPSEDVVVRLSGVLSPDEQARADRFVFDRDRRRFRAARGWLRTLLGRCLEIDPAAVRFEYSKTGKPCLPAAPLHFNLAHSDDLAVVAVTGVAPVGIDVERVRPLEHAADLVARFFSPRETRVFQSLPSDRQLTAFFNLWTRKEAVLKATGAGLTTPLHRVEVSFLPDAPARLIAIDQRPDLAAAWRIDHLSPCDGFVGAVAIERPQNV